MQASEPEVKPLVCAVCGAAVALADEDELICYHCEAKVAVPLAHRDALRSARQDASARAEARRLYAELSRPVRGWVRAVAFLFGGAVESLWRSKLNVVLRYFLTAYLGAFNFCLVVLLAAMPFVLPSLFYGYATHRNTAETMTYAEANSRDLFALGATVVTLLVCTALGVYGRKSTIEVGSLQAAMAARPPLHPGGPATCRSCGGPLHVEPDDLGVRCPYCRADNLVALSPRVLERFQSHARDAARTIEDAHAQMLAEAAGRKRQALRRVSVLAVVLLVWFGGTALSVEARRASTPALDTYPPPWWAHLTDPRPVLRRRLNEKTRARLDATDRVAMPAACEGPVPGYAPEACEGGSCTTVLYVALRQGEWVRLRNLGARPVRAELSWHRISGFPRRVDDSFGTVSGVATVPNGGGAQLRATWDSWHELRLIEAGARPDEAPRVCVEVAPP